MTTFTVFCKHNGCQFLKENLDNHAANRIASGHASAFGHDVGINKVKDEHKFAKDKATFYSKELPNTILPEGTFKVLDQINARLNAKAKNRL